MKRILLKNGEVVNEGKRFVADILIKGERIEKIAGSIDGSEADEVIDLGGKLILPGCIDDQVCFC